MQVLRLNPQNLKMDPDPAAKWKFIGIHHKLCYLPKLSLFQTGWKNNTPVWLNTSWYIYIPVKIQVLTQSEKATSLPVRSFKKGLGFTGTVAIGPGSPAPSFSANVWADADFFDSMIYHPYLCVHRGNIPYTESVRRNLKSGGQDFSGPPLDSIFGGWCSRAGF